MQKRHKTIWSLGVILLILFFLSAGACGKKEEVSEKPKVVSKKVVSKKVSKPAPKKVEKNEPDKSEQEKNEEASKETPKPVKQEEAPGQVKKEALEDGKGKITTATLTDKKKPAFKPKSDISSESDYTITSDPGLQVAKKQDTKASDPTMKSESEKKDDSIKTEQKEIPAKSKGEDVKKTEMPDIPDQAAKKDDAGKDKGQQKDSSSEVEEKEESPSIEVKEPDKKQERSESVAKLTPSKTLTPVKIEPLTPDFEYKPEGKIDPFSSLFKVKEESRKKKRKRFPLTPLEKTDISQFKLVGVILSAKGNKAIVQEASGKGYVISKGTYIGVNDGQVVEILKDRVICEEEVENLFGETEIKSRILKINKPPEAL